MKYCYVSNFEKNKTKQNKTKQNKTKQKRNKTKNKTKQTNKQTKTKTKQKQKTLKNPYFWILDTVIDATLKRDMMVYSYMYPVCRNPLIFGYFLLDLLNPNQPGFCPHLSTETCRTDMVDTWLFNMNGGKMTGVAFIDLRKAFDAVNHSILLKKIRDMGGSDLTLKWFISYLPWRVQILCFKNSLSDVLKVNTGVSQGSILRPFLFIIFINSMSSVIKYGKICRWYKLISK